MPSLAGLLSSGCQLGGALKLVSLSPALVFLPHTASSLTLSASSAMGSDPQYAKWPLLPLSQHVYILTNAHASRTAHEAAARALRDAITQDKMAPFYRYLAHPVEGLLNAVADSGGSASTKPSSRKSSLVGMVANRTLTSGVDFHWDQELYTRLKEDNDKELAGLQKEEDEAVEQAGETEVLAAQGKRAEFWARVGDKVTLPTDALTVILSFYVCNS